MVTGAAEQAGALQFMSLGYESTLGNIQLTEA